jgi:hypothetical protein
MRVLWVSAHPDPRSLTGALRDHGVAVLREHGHEVRESGMTVVAPFVVTGTVALSDDEYADAAKRLTERLLTLPESEPIPFRHQNGGDYDEHLVLRPVHAPGETGVGIHYATNTVHCDEAGGDKEAPADRALDSRGWGQRRLMLIGRPSLGTGRAVGSHWTW